MQLFAEPCVVTADNVAHAPMQAGMQATKHKTPQLLVKESTHMAKTPKIRLVLVHVELENECDDLEKLVAGRAHTICGVGLATPVTITEDCFIVDLPGGEVFTCTSVNDLMKASFK